MFKKVFYIIKDFYKSTTKIELFETIVLPFIITVILFVFVNDVLTIDDVVDFNSTILSIVSLLVAFGISSTTLLFSTSNNNIDSAKETITDRIRSNGFKINYFQLVQIRAYYVVVVELMLIAISMLSSVILLKLDLFIIFYINVFLLIHILFTLFLSMISMYHLSISNR